MASVNRKSGCVYSAKTPSEAAMATVHSVIRRRTSDLLQQCAAACVKTHGEVGQM